MRCVSPSLCSPAATPKDPNAASKASLQWQGCAPLWCRSPARWQCLLGRGSINPFQRGGRAPRHSAMLSTCKAEYLLVPLPCPGRGNLLFLTGFFICFLYQHHVCWDFPPAPAFLKSEGYYRVVVRTTAPGEATNAFQMPFKCPSPQFLEI